MEERVDKGQQQVESFSSQRVLSVATRKMPVSLCGSGEMLKSGSGHARKELDLICHMKEMLSLLGGSNCLDLVQLHGQ